MADFFCIPDESIPWTWNIKTDVQTFLFLSAYPDLIESNFTSPNSLENEKWFCSLTKFSVFSLIEFEFNDANIYWFIVNMKSREREREVKERIKMLSRQYEKIWSKNLWTVSIFVSDEPKIHDDRANK